MILYVWGFFVRERRLKDLFQSCIKSLYKDANDCMNQKSCLHIFKTGKNKGIIFEVFQMWPQNHVFLTHSRNTSGPPLKFGNIAYWAIQAICDLQRIYRIYQPKQTPPVLYEVQLRFSWLVGSEIVTSFDSVTHRKHREFYFIFQTFLTKCSLKFEK